MDIVSWVLNVMHSANIKQFRRKRSPSSSRQSSASNENETELSDQSGSDLTTSDPLGLQCLSSGSSPVVDFIFVHGLGGGSRRTWTKFDSPKSFWPKEWLPHDPDLHRVRIHSFGYQADWRSSGNVLDVHDFGRSLISNLLNDPKIRKSQVSDRLGFPSHISY